MKIAEEHLDSLMGLGYTPLEARFVYIAETHSGYFTHRQFLNFWGTKRQEDSWQFLAKLLSRKHATCHAYHTGRQVYHICAPSILRALDRDDLSTLLNHQLDYIKTRLVTLDFVLAHLEYEYLETEAEKVSFFESRLNIPRSLLPSKTYGAKGPSSGTVRYFVDRFPIFLKDPSVSSVSVCLTYVDACYLTLQAFIRHLKAYRDLLRALPKFEFLYIAPNDHFFKGAGLEFSRQVLGTKRVAPTEKILRYFQVRKRWENGERVAASDVVFLNATENELRNASVDILYGKWIEGTIEDSDMAAQLGDLQRHIHGKFLAQRYGESLAVFDPSPAGRNETPDDSLPENSTAKGTAGSLPSTA